MRKSSTWQIRLVVMGLAAILFGLTTPIDAADEDRSGPAERLDRMERRVNELGQWQQQLMHQLAAASEHPGSMALPGGGNLPPGLFKPGKVGMGQPMPTTGVAVPPGMPVPAGAPVCPAKCCKDIGGLIGLVLLVAFIFNILVASWIYTDIRKRGEGSGIFIALALLAGVPAAIIYAIVRIGDRKP
jgi:hypothetical protein